MRSLHLLACAAAGVIAGALVAPLVSTPAVLPGAQPTSGAAGAAPASSSGDKAGAPGSFTNPATQPLVSALKEPVELRRHARIHAAIEALTPAGLAQAADVLAKLPTEFHYEVVMPLFKRWFRADAAAAAEWLGRHPHFFGWAASAWREADPKGATRAALSGAFGAKSNQLLNGALSGLSRSEAIAFWGELKALPPGALRDEALQDAVESFAKMDPATAFRMADELGSERDRLTAKLAILDAWPVDMAKERLARLDELLPELTRGLEGRCELSRVVSTIAQTDTEAAIEWAAALPPEQRVGPGIAAAREWAEKEPVKALQWCREHGIPIGRAHWVQVGGWQSSVLGNAIAQRPAETVAWLESLPPGAERDGLLESGLANALRYLAKPRQFDDKDPVVMRLFGQLSPEAQERHASRLGLARSEQGPIANLGAWADQFGPQGATRELAIAGAMSGSFKRDASQVDSLLESLPGRDDRDAALRGLVEAMSWQHPADAASRALEISSDSGRREALASVFSSWRSQAPGEAAQWLAAQGPRVPVDWQREWDGRK